MGKARYTTPEQKLLLAAWIRDESLKLAAQVPPARRAQFCDNVAKIAKFAGAPLTAAQKKSLKKGG